MVVVVGCRKVIDEDSGQQAQSMGAQDTEDEDHFRWSGKNSGCGNVHVRVEAPRQTVSNGVLVLTSEAGDAYTGTYRMRFLKGKVLRDSKLPIDASIPGHALGTAHIPAGRWTLSQIRFDTAQGSQGIVVQLPIVVHPGGIVKVRRALDSREWVAVWLEDNKHYYSCEGMEQPVELSKMAADLAEDSPE